MSKEPHVCACPKPGCECLGSVERDGDICTNCQRGSHEFPDEHGS
jgi:hypothetical protein